MIKLAYKAMAQAMRKRNYYHSQMNAHDDLLHPLHSEALLERSYAFDMWRLNCKRVQFLQDKYLNQKIRNHFEDLYPSSTTD